jgi:hypothetical protein
MPPEGLPGRRSTRTEQMSRGWHQEDLGAITPVPSLARHYCRTAWERPDPTVQPADGVKGDPPCLWRNIDIVDPGVTPTDDLVICRQNHWEFILGLDVFHAHNAFMDLGHCVLWLGEGEVPLWCPRAWPCSSSHRKDNSEMVPTWCGRVVTMRVEGLLEALDSLVGLSSKAIHKAGVPRVRMLGQRPGEGVC